MHHFTAIDYTDIKDLLYHYCCCCLQALLSEIEFEWLRQWYIQGAAHASAHAWWAQPIAQLLQQWCALEDRTSAVLTLLYEVRSATVVYIIDNFRKH
jgi:FTO C-terminal domain